MCALILAYVALDLSSYVLIVLVAGGVHHRFSSTLCVRAPPPFSPAGATERVFSRATPRLTRLLARVVAMACWLRYVAIDALSFAMLWPVLQYNADVEAAADALDDALEARAELLVLAHSMARRPPAISVFGARPHPRQLLVVFAYYGAYLAAVYVPASEWRSLVYSRTHGYSQLTKVAMCAAVLLAPLASYFVAVRATTAQRARPSEHGPDCV